jgi:tRNA(Ile)-lysidine synthase
MARKLMLGLDKTLLKAGERVCVAVSGGADSTALLVAMAEARADWGVVLSAAHVHHGLRGADADADEVFVRELCGQLDVPLTVFRVDTAERMAARGEGLEEAARELRYDALHGLDVDAVATAHTLNDQAETVVMKMLRGAWTEGLAGIAAVVQGSGKVKIVRPMLGVRRAEVEAFLRERGQAWREDASNKDLGLMRNRVRHVLMPMLREFNPKVDEALARTAGIARDEESFWQAEVERVLAQVLLPGKPVRGGGRAVSTSVGEESCSLEIARLAAMTSALRRRVVRAAAKTMGVRLSAEETAKVLALAGFGGYSGVTGKIGSRLELQAGLRVERSARELRFWRAGIS